MLGRLGTHGPSLIRLQLAAELLSRGVDVDIVLGTDQNNSAHNLPVGCNLHVLQAERPREFILKLRKYLKAEKPDGVLASSWPFSIATILAVKLFSSHTKVVVSEHTDFRTNIRDSGEFTPKDAWLIKKLSRYIYNRADRVVGVSQGVIDGLTEVAKVNPRKTARIFNPLRQMCEEPPLDLSKRALRDNFWTETSIKILAVGRLAPQKNYEVMLNTLSILRKDRDFRLIIVGDGALKAKLQEQIQSLSLEGNVLLVGSTYSVSEYYDKADLFLMSSSSEGFGNVIVEALSFGLPVVSTDCQSGPSEILAAGEYGVLTPVGDAEALAAGVKQALAVKSEPDKQRQRSNYFSIETATDQYLSALFSQSRAK